MTNQSLKQQYNELEAQRMELKEQWRSLNETTNNQEEIKQISQKLVELTFNQANILIELEPKE